VVKKPSEQARNDEQSDESDFLSGIGKAVRGLRASRGMTRKMLSQHSNVSERYLANLEQGHGNISINLLRQVAGALDANISDLLPSSTKITPEHSLINDFISRLDREQQQSTLRMLYEEFSGPDKHQERFALIGLRGAGKTALGNLLQERRGIPLIRLGKQIEKIAGMPVAEILNLSGQNGYRRFEEQALFQTLNSHTSCCIETGGSIVSEARGLNMLLSTCRVIWVKTSPEEHMQRVIEQGDTRPMVDNEDAMDDLRTILAERTPFYEQAHYVLDTSGKTVEESYQDLIEIITDEGKVLAS
tara:strand:- start:23832 stop:24737 length:906 start_codon:yes stop_codon:yes gene_type:complete